MDETAPTKAKAATLRLNLPNHIITFMLLLLRQIPLQKFVTVFFPNHPNTFIMKYSNGYNESNVNSCKKCKISVSFSPILGGDFFFTVSCVLYEKRVEPKFHPTIYQQAIHLVIHGTSVTERLEEFIARLDDGVLLLARFVRTNRRERAAKLGRHLDFGLE